MYFYYLIIRNGDSVKPECYITTYSKATVINPEGVSVITYSRQTTNDYYYDCDSCVDSGNIKCVEYFDGICYKQSVNHKTIVGVDDLNYELKHKIYTTDMSASSDGSEGKNMVTVFKYHNGTEAHIFPVGVPIELSIKDWVDLAGISLDDINYNVNINNENNKHNSYRFTGVNLQVTLDYDNSDDISINFGNVTNLISSILLIYFS